MLSNCLIEALREWRRLDRQWIADGRQRDKKPSIFIRRSHLYPDWVPHFGIEHEGKRRGFVPYDKRPLKGLAAVKAALFLGYWAEEM